MIFHKNPKRKQLNLKDNDVVSLCQKGQEYFSSWPLFHKGESKEIRQTPIPGLLMQKLIPSLNSITRQRKGFVRNTDILRQEISTLFLKMLHHNNIPTCYLAQENEYMLISKETIPPVEVIIKAALVGTPVKIYEGLFTYKDRFGKPFVEKETHAPYVRFDYRNPLQNRKGDYLRDECLPIGLANRFINTQKAEVGALKIFELIQNFLNQAGFRVLDSCFFFDEEGEILCGEISPDNMRIKDDKNDHFDKDLWRDGWDDQTILARWTELKQRLENIAF